MWIKHENNSEYYKVYDKITPITKWMIDMLSKVVSFCVFRRPS